MNAQTIDHARLVRLIEAGEVQGAQVVGRPGGWSLSVRCDAVERTLAAQRSGQVRVFRHMETLVNYLKDIGIERFDVDAAGYEAGPSRTMRQERESADHDRWFREHVEMALREADNPNTEWVSNEDARKEWEEMRARLEARIAAGDKG